MIELSLRCLFVFLHFVDLESLYTQRLIQSGPNGSWKDFLEGLCAARIAQQNKDQKSLEESMIDLSLLRGLLESAGGKLGRHRRINDHEMKLSGEQRFARFGQLFNLSLKPARLGELNKSKITAILMQSGLTSDCEPDLAKLKDGIVKHCQIAFENGFDKILPADLCHTISFGDLLHFQLQR